MKIITAISMLTLFFTVSVFGSEGYFDDLDKDQCPGMVVSPQEVLCEGVKNSKQILAAKLIKANQVSFEVAQSKVSKWNYQSAVDLGVLPDDSTSGIYDYIYLLKNSSQKVIGYTIISGYVNSEMEVRLQVTATYSTYGELVSASVKDDGF